MRQSFQDLKYDHKYQALVDFERCCADSVNVSRSYPQDAIRQEEPRRQVSAPLSIEQYQGLTESMGRFSSQKILCLHCLGKWFVAASVLTSYRIRALLACRSPALP